MKRTRLVNVSPGDPITARGQNGLIDAVNRLQNFTVGEGLTNKNFGDSYILEVDRTAMGSMARIEYVELLSDIVPDVVDTAPEESSSSGQFSSQAFSGSSLGNSSSPSTTSGGNSSVANSESGSSASTASSASSASSQSTSSSVSSQGSSATSESTSSSVHSTGSSGTSSSSSSIFSGVKNAMTRPAIILKWNPAIKRWERDGYNFIEVSDQCMRRGQGVFDVGDRIFVALHRQSNLWLPMPQGNVRIAVTVREPHGYKEESSASTSTSGSSAFSSVSSSASSTSELMTDGSGNIVEVDSMSYSSLSSISGFSASSSSLSEFSSSSSSRSSSSSSSLYYPATASTPNVYAIAFCDAEYADLAGDGDETIAAKNPPPVPHNYVLNLTGDYIPLGTNILVFHQQGRWYTIYSNLQAAIDANRTRVDGYKVDSYIYNDYIYPYFPVTSYNYNNPTKLIFEDPNLYYRAGSGSELGNGYVSWAGFLITGDPPVNTMPGYGMCKQMIFSGHFTVDRFATPGAASAPLLAKISCVLTGKNKEGVINRSGDQPFWGQTLSLTNESPLFGTVPPTKVALNSSWGTTLTIEDSYRQPTSFGGQPVANNYSFSFLQTKIAGSGLLDAFAAAGGVNPGNVMNGVIFATPEPFDCKVPNFCRENDLKMILLQGLAIAIPGAVGGAGYAWNQSSTGIPQNGEFGIGSTGAMLYGGRSIGGVVIDNGEAITGIIDPGF